MGRLLDTGLRRIKRGRVLKISVYIQYKIIVLGDQ